MRILMFSELYAPSIGGTQRHVQVLAHEMIRRGHEVAVATQALEGSPTYEVDHAGVRIYRLAGWGRLLRPFYESATRPFHPPLTDPGLVAGLRQVIEKERPDIVHGHSWMLYSYLPLRSRYDMPLVVTLHDYSLTCPRRSYLRNGQVCDGPAYSKCVRCGVEQYGMAKSLLITTALQIGKRAHHKVDEYIAVSKAVRDASIQAAGRSPRPMDVISTFVPDGVLTSHPERPRPAFLPPTDNYILFVGELARHKGLQVLLEAYQDPDLASLAPLMLIGSQNDKSTLNLPPGVKVARDVGHDDVMSAWEHCAVGVVPSVWPEPFGQVAVEAMAARKPVVASAVGGLVDIVIDNETGILVPPGDPEALRAALRSLLLDPARRASMGEAGHARARLFMVGAVADQIEEVYRKLLDHADAGAPQ